jgi:hypothetical protein
MPPFQVTHSEDARRVDRGEMCSGHLTQVRVYSLTGYRGLQVQTLEVASGHRWVGHLSARLLAELLHCHVSQDGHHGT